MTTVRGPNWLTQITIPEPGSAGCCWTYTAAWREVTGLIFRCTLELWINCIFIFADSFIFARCPGKCLHVWHCSFCVPRNATTALVLLIRHTLTPFQFKLVFNTELQQSPELGNGVFRAVGSVSNIVDEIYKILVPSFSARVSFNCCWVQAGAFLQPNGVLKYSYLAPPGITKAKYCLLSSSTSIWLKNDDTSTDQ